MTDKLELEIDRGEHAERLLRDPLLNSTLDRIEQEYIEKWKSSPARDEVGRETLWLMVKTVHKFRQELEIVLDAGKSAKATLAQRAGQTLKRAFS